MCGRYGFIPGKDLYDRFELEDRRLTVEDRYNVAPGERMPVLTKNSPKKIEMMRWGLIPFWAKDPRIAYSTINARCEDIENKPAFRKPFKQQRCLVPASGFFEWRKVMDEGKPRKIPYWIRLKNLENFGFAGVYDIWKDAEDYEIKSFAIVTTTANSLMREIHDRMPVILDKNSEDTWIDNQITDIKILKNLLVPYPSDQTEAWRVADLVNNPRNNSLKILEKIETEYN
jgi:putative SOS response-associated peptidase YedK